MNARYVMIREKCCTHFLIPERDGFHRPCKVAMSRRIDLAVAPSVSGFQEELELHGFNGRKISRSLSPVKTGLIIFSWERWGNLRI